MRLLKRIVEMIFIFLLPLLLVLTMFKTTKVYDSNNNEISRYIEFNNIFTYNDEIMTYYYYEYYDHNEIITLYENDSILVNYNISPVTTYLVNNTPRDYIYYLYNNQFYFIETDALANNGTSTNWDITFNESNVVIFRLGVSSAIIQNRYDNLIRSVKSYSMRDNIINQGVNLIFGFLGIQQNIIAQLLVVYVLLILIMLLIWYIIYVPFDMLFGLLLRKLEYYK